MENSHNQTEIQSTSANGNDRQDTVNRNSNRLGKKNYTAVENLQLLDLVDTEKKFNAGNKDPIWSRALPGRTDVVYNHFRDMVQAMKAARSNCSQAFPQMCSSSTEPISPEYTLSLNNYYSNLLSVLKSDSKKYFASTWWSIEVVRKLCTMQMNQETMSGTDKIQNANTILEMKQLYTNKYEAEQKIRTEKLNAMKKEEQERQKRNDQYKERLISGFIDLVDAIKGSSNNSTPILNQQRTNHAGLVTPSNLFSSSVDRPEESEVKKELKEVQTKVERLENMVTIFDLIIFQFL